MAHPFSTRRLGIFQLLIFSHRQRAALLTLHSKVVEVLMQEHSLFAVVHFKHVATRRTLAWLAIELRFPID